MQRHEWKFSYPADVLLDAATKKHAFHQERLKWWEAKKAEVLAKIKAEGIEIDESLSDMASNKYRGESVSIRNDLMVDVQETVTKTREHRDQVARYDAWMQTFASQGKTAFDLHHDDWMFFFGK